MKTEFDGAKKFVAKRKITEPSVKIEDNLVNVPYHFQMSEEKQIALAMLEKELGIDLITLFKALKNGAYIPFYGQIMSLERYKLDFPNKRFIAKYFNGNEWEETLYFKDYGKTWALTKEELE